MSKARGEPEIHPYLRAQRQRDKLLRLVRAAFFVVFVTVTALAILSRTLGDDDAVLFGDVALEGTWWATLLLAVLFGAAAIATDALTPSKKISTLSAVFFGLLVAMLATFAMGSIIDLLVELWEITTAGGATPTIVRTIKVLLGIGLAYVCISTVLQTQDDFRLVVPYVEFAKQLRGPRPILLDTSTLIDARIADVAATGIFQAPMLVPAFVVEELQALADSGDSVRRERGRRGLGVIADLQGAPLLDVVIDQTAVPARSVDQMLVELARRTGAIIATTDTGLAAVAKINAVGVLSVHDLARACKPVTLAGEGFLIRLVRPGEQPGQAVGYLDDGTMVVVGEGAGLIGRTVEVLAQSSIPTAAGRLVFARLSEPAGPESDHASPEPKPTAGVQREDAEPRPENHPAPPTLEGPATTPVPSQPRRPGLSTRAATGRNPRR